MEKRYERKIDFSFSVHFKIHVPEIIKHHIHTKTVYIHVHEPKKEEPHEEHHHEEDWSSWKYNHYETTDDHQDDHNDHHDQQNYHHQPDPLPGYHNHQHRHFPVVQSHQSDHLDEKPVEESHYPHKELSHNDLEDPEGLNEPNVKAYEEGYSRGGESETGHKFTHKLTKFHGSNREEGDHDYGDFENKGYLKTNTGRYLINEDPYYPKERRRKFRARSGMSKGHPMH
ncbi:sex-determining region Y protein-like [Prorops nasuta]|uniref:sex-determining region Y protein-like n=1 Tax=Prorops nasuta TaxID=863751 RepID=UPI0034CEC750